MHIYLFIWYWNKFECTSGAGAWSPAGSVGAQAAWALEYRSARVRSTLVDSRLRLRGGCSGRQVLRFAIGAGRRAGQLSGVALGSGQRVPRAGYVP